MKKSALVIGTVVFLIVFLAAGILSAQNPVVKREPVGRPPMPDLIVSDIDLLSGTQFPGCWIRVTLKNMGDGGVPDSIYSGNAAAVQMYRGNQPHGGMVLRVFDPSGLLKTPGASVTKVWFQGSSGMNLDPGVHSIRVDVDASGDIAELNESNNSRTERLTCTLPAAGKCCVAGTYQGEHKDTLSATCTNPKTEKFILTIAQAADCGSSIKGEVKTIKSGVTTLTHHVTGTVTPAATCCRLEGRLTEFPAPATRAPKVITITATLCEKGGKWYSTNGVYNDPTGCSGTFILQ